MTSKHTPTPVGVVTKIREARKLGLYNSASKALDDAHKACFNHPDRDVLGMSRGPFSGTNEALGIISEAEEKIYDLLRAYENNQATIKALTEALWVIESMATIESVGIQKIAREALKKAGK